MTVRNEWEIKYIKCNSLLFNYLIKHLHPDDVQIKSLKITTLQGDIQAYSFDFMLKKNITVKERQMNSLLFGLL